MGASLANVVTAEHHVSSASRRRMAKVHTVSHGNSAYDPLWLLIGECMDEVRREFGLSVDEFSNAIDRDPRNVGKWLKGTERPQFETVFAIERFQKPLVIALARRVKSLHVTAQISERSA